MTVLAASLLVASMLAVVLALHDDTPNRIGCSTGYAAPQRAAQSGQWVSRSGSTLRLDGARWRASGVNMYWLGLDDNTGNDYPSHRAVDNGFAAAAALGARLVRSTTLGVSVGSPRSVEPTAGRFNDAAFAAIDYAVAAARRYGVRLMIPLTDEGHYYHGGEDTFTNWYGHPAVTPDGSSPSQQSEGSFYTDPVVVAAFNTYVEHVLRHVNPLTGLALGNDPTIAVWETGNEVYDAPTAWTEQTAHLIRTLAPHALVADGSAATGKDISTTAYAEPDVDIVDAHYYPVDVAKTLADAAFVAAHDRVYMVGEFPLTGAGVASWLSKLVASSAVSADLAWSLLPTVNCVPEQHSDGYTFHYPGASSTEERWDRLLQANARAMSR